jgi:hypothetical protein
MNCQENGGKDRWHCERQDRCIQGLVRKLVGKGPHRRPWCWMEDNIKMVLKEIGWGKAWTKLIGRRTVTSNRMLWTWQWTYGFHTTQGISRLAEELLASKERLCSMESVRRSVSQSVRQEGQFSWYNDNHSKFLVIPFTCPTNLFSDLNFTHFYWVHLQNFEKRLLVSSCLSVCLSVCVHPRGTTQLPRDGFSRNLNLSVFIKFVKKIQVSLESHKNNGYFTWTPIHISDHTSLNSS